MTESSNGTATSSAEAGQHCFFAALDYRRRGWSPLALCPCDHAGVTPRHADRCKRSSWGKAPVIRWKQHQKTPPTEKQLTGWWAANPRSNVGMAMGPGGVVGIDEDGDEGRRLLQEASGGDLPQTLQFCRGTKSRRLLYKMPDSIILRITKFAGDGDHEELRFLGVGSQTVMPPSRHQSGHLYQWAPGHGPDEIEIAAAPAWLVEVMREGSPFRKTAGSTYRENSRATTPGSYEELTDGLLEQIVAHLTTCPKAVSGRRGHDALMWAARCVVWGFNVGPQVGYGLLASHYNPRCLPEWSEPELRHKCKEADEKAFNKPRGWLLANNEGVANGVRLKKQIVPFSMTKIVQTVRHVTNDWPRRVGGSLFVPSEGVGVSWLEGTPALFGYLASTTGTVRWFKGVGCPSKEETYAELRRVATSYEAVEALPHWPRLANHFYACTFPEPGDGRTLRALVERFCPLTDIDGDLTEALFVSTVWGGVGGTRPGFIITSEAGRGTGKTTLAVMAGHVVGGVIELSANENAEVIKQRLLSPEGLTRRVALLDNVKSLRFSWAELESLITSPVISGKRLYVGEASRPNTLTWVVTLNGASLGTDMAQRSVIIKLDKPEHAAGWKEETFRFIEANRTAIVADCLGFFGREPADLRTFSRWSSWERDILSRLSDPEEAQRVILERQGQANVEEEEHEIVEAFFERQLAQFDYNPDADVVFLASEVASVWFNQATNMNQSTIAISRILSQAIDEGRLRRIQKNKCKTYGRGFVWRGKDAAPSENVRFDLHDRMDAKKQRAYNPFSRRAHGV